LLRLGWPDVYRVVGLPSWVALEGYDVNVKPPAGSSPERVQEMWRNLLVARLKLAARVEPREVPAYALTLSRNDGRLGPQLRPSTLRCDGVDAQKPRAAFKSRTDFAAQGCPVQYWLDSAVGRIVSGGADLDQFAEQLRSAVGRPAVNRTNLKGRYAIDLRYSAGIADDLSPLADAPDVYAALRDQLGLKVEATTTTVQFLVVDHIERPREEDN
jgi:uncharacterized protein (TIGR03435 family)